MEMGPYLRILAFVLQISVLFGGIFLCIKMLKFCRNCYFLEDDNVNFINLSVNDVESGMDQTESSDIIIPREVAVQIFQCQPER